MNNRRQKSAGRWNQGFTMVEMIVVMVILSILLAVSAGALVQYQKYSAYKRNNEYAQTLFIASQSALTHDKVSGKLEELKESLTPTVQVGDEIAKAGDYDYTGRLYYLEIKAGEELADNALYQLIGDYVYDKSILKKAAVRLEFDPTDGTAFSLCYSDRADSFDESSKDGKGDRVMGVSLANRQEKRRKEIILGYASSGLSSQSPSASSSSSSSAEGEEPVINHVQLVNGDTLMLTWDMDQRFKSRIGTFTHAVRIYDENNTLKVSFSISRPAGLGNEHSDLTKIKDIPVTFYNADGTTSEKKCDFEAYVNDQSEVCLLLDAVDVEAAALQEESEDTADYSNTYSIMRLIDKPQRIYAEVQALSSYNKASEWKASNTEHTMMKVLGNSADATYGVENARHLFNIRFMEAQDEETNRGFHYKQIADVKWGGDNGIVAQRHVFAGTTVVAADTQAFPAIHELSQDSSYDGLQKTQASPWQIQSLTLTESDSEYLGLFRTNWGSIANLVLTDVTVNGTDYVGAVCGLNEGTLKDAVVESGSVTGRHYVGGLVGSDSDTDEARNDGDYENLSNGAAISGVSNVGGIMGKTTAATVKNCTNTGGILAVAANGTYIGGLFGFNDGAALSGCKSTMDNDVPASYTPAGLPGTYVGGLVGYQKNGSIRDCETLGGNVIGGMYVGGIAGAYEGPPETMFDTNHPQKNGADVIGWKYVGGILGVNAAIDEATGLPREENDESLVLYNCTNQGNVSAGYEIADTTADAGGYAGGIVGYNAGVITDCQLDAAVEVTGRYAVGGIAAENYGRIMTGSLPGRIIGAADTDNTCVGGVIGKNYGTIEDINGADISDTVWISAARGYVGGIVGYLAPYGSVERCSNNAGWTISVNGDSAEDAIGGIIGYSATAQPLSELTNYAAVISDGSAACVGGIVGRISVDGSVDALNIISCINYGSLTNAGARGRTGGIAGLTDAASSCAISISHCCNAGSFAVAANAVSGGILGLNSSWQETYIVNCRNYAMGMRSGIVDWNEADILLEVADCFGVARQGVTYPISSMSAMYYDNYYFSFNRAHEDGAGIQITQEPSGTLGYGELLYLLPDGAGYRGYDKDTVEIIAYLPLDPVAAVQDGMNARRLYHEIDVYLDIN